MDELYQFLNIFKIKIRRTGEIDIGELYQFLDARSSMNK
jgi:hypothetical protein